MLRAPVTEEGVARKKDDQRLDLEVLQSARQEDRGVEASAETVVEHVFRSAHPLSRFAPARRRNRVGHLGVLDGAADCCDDGAHPRGAALVAVEGRRSCGRAEQLSGVGAERREPGLLRLDESGQRGSSLRGAASHHPLARSEDIRSIEEEIASRACRLEEQMKMRGALGVDLKQGCSLREDADCEGLPLRAEPSQDDRTTGGDTLAINLDADGDADVLEGNPLPGPSLIEVGTVVIDRSQMDGHGQVPPGDGVGIGNDRGSIDGDREEVEVSPSRPWQGRWLGHDAHRLVVGRGQRVGDGRSRPGRGAPGALVPRRRLLARCGRLLERTCSGSVQRLDRRLGAGGGAPPPTSPSWVRQPYKPRVPARPGRMP